MADLLEVYGNDKAAIWPLLASKYEVTPLGPGVRVRVLRHAGDVAASLRRHGRLGSGALRAPYSRALGEVFAVEGVGGMEVEVDGTGQLVVLKAASSSASSAAAAAAVAAAAATGEEEEKEKEGGEEQLVLPQDVLTVVPPPGRKPPSPPPSPSPPSPSPPSPLGAGGTSDAFALSGRDQVGAKHTESVGEKGLRAGSAQACQAACVADADCEIWVLQPSTGMCWLMAGALATVEAADRTVGGRGAALSRAVACEGQSARLACAGAGDAVIQVAAAVYGRLEKSTCPHATNTRHDWAAAASEMALRCHMSAHDRVRAIDEACNGKRSCSLTASNDFFKQTGGDPCPNIFKYLEVTYTCVQKQAARPAADTRRRREPPPARKSRAVPKTDKYCSSADGPLCTLAVAAP